MAFPSTTKTNAVREAYLLIKDSPPIRSESQTIVQLSLAAGRPVIPQNLAGKARLTTTPVAISTIRKGRPAFLVRDRSSAIAATLKHPNRTARIRSPISAAAKPIGIPFF
jgi:hypothetical protein